MEHGKRTAPDRARSPLPPELLTIIQVDGWKLTSRPNADRRRRVTHRTAYLRLILGTAPIEAASYGE